MFFPGETDFHIFTIPFMAEDISRVIVSYKQRDRVILEKEASAAETVEEFKCQVTVSLTQQETLRFCDDEPIAIQLNVYSTENARVTSRPILIRCGEQFYREVM